MLKVAHVGIRTNIIIDYVSLAIKKTCYIFTTIGNKLCQSNVKKSFQGNITIFLKEENVLAVWTVTVISSAIPTFFKNRKLCPRTKIL